MKQMMLQLTSLYEHKKTSAEEAQKNHEELKAHVQEEVKKNSDDLKLQVKGEVTKSQDDLKAHVAEELAAVAHDVNKSLEGSSDRESRKGTAAT